MSLFVPIHYQKVPFNSRKKTLRKVNIYTWFFLPFQLVSASPNQRNWRGILIALLVIIIVLALIITSVVSTYSNYWSTKSTALSNSTETLPWNLLRSLNASVLRWFYEQFEIAVIKENVFELFKCWYSKLFCYTQNVRFACQ